MENHVKLEIAIQIVAEEIAELYNMRDKAKSVEEVNNINQKLVDFYEKKERVSLGDFALINEVLASKQNGKGDIELEK